MKKSVKQNPTSTRSRSRYLTREQAESILKLLESEGLPEHDLPFKLYFNDKLVASASQPTQLNNDKTKQHEQ